MSVSKSAPSLLVATALALAAASSLGCTHQVTAATSPAAQSITVVGRGEVRAKPDLARITLGVESRTPTVAEGSRLTNEKIAQVIAAVRGVGVAEADVRTSNYSIYFERFPTPDGYPVPYPVPQTFVAPAADAAASGPAVAPAAPPSKGRASKGPPAAPAPAPVPPAAAPMPVAPPSAPAGVYRVANTIEITVRDIGKVAQVLDAAVSTGANEVQGVSFDLDAREPFDAKVREKAVTDARERAEVLAKLHGKKLGEVLAVSEVVSDGGRPIFAPMPMMAKDASFGGAQISTGEITVGGQLQVVYAFED